MTTPSVDRATVPGFVIFVNGGYGTGKTSVLDHLADALAAAGRPFSLFDVDWFHRSWPPADHDPDNVVVEAENIAATWRHYRRAGPRQPIVSGVLTGPDDTERYRLAFGLPIRPVLLTASPEVTERRLRGRYTTDQTAALDWHLEHHQRDATRIAEGGQYEVTIATDDRRPAEVAQLIIAHFGLIA